MHRPFGVSLEVWDRFWSKVEPGENGCLEWTASHNGRGYGRCQINNRMRPAYHWTYEWNGGVIPDGMEIDHICENPKCVNPSHLEAVTPTENKHRRIGRTSQCRRGHEYTDANTYICKDGDRRCRECMRMVQREYYTGRWEDDSRKEYVAAWEEQHKKDRRAYKAEWYKRKKLSIAS